MSDTIEINLIDPNPDQPRRRFDPVGLEELAQSMTASGLIQPIMLRPVDGRFVIVHGERRYRAALALGWESIPAEVRDVSPEEAAWLALVENIQRDDLTPIEEARAYQAHLANGATQAELAHRIGKDRSAVSQKLRLLKLPTDAQDAIDAGKLTEGHGRQLLRLRDAEILTGLCRRAIAEGWAVARTKLEVDGALAGDPDPTSPAEMVRWAFRRDGGIPHHDPYPEERLPDRYSPPIAVKRLPIREIGDLPWDYRSDGRDSEYAEWLAEIFDTLPSIAVFQIDGRYILADGKYRLMAAELLGLTEIECRIYAGETLREVDLYGVAANAAQGIPMLRKDWQHTLTKDRAHQAVITEAISAAAALAYHERRIERGLDQMTSDQGPEELRAAAGGMGAMLAAGCILEHRKAQRESAAADVSRDTIGGNDGD